MILSTQVRDRIVYWVAQNAFKKEREALANEKANLSEQWRVSWNGGPIACAVIDALPEGVVHTEWTHWISGDISLEPKGRVASKEQDGYSHQEWIVLTQQLHDKTEDLAKRKLALVKEVRDALISCRTVKRARELFPEFEEMYPTEVSAGLPMVVADRVRESLCVAGVITCEEPRVEA